MASLGRAGRWPFAGAVLGGPGRVAFASRKARGNQPELRETRGEWVGGRVGGV
jgi:hypothetical protein